MFSGVYRYLGNCARHLGSYTEALEGYAQASMLDHSDYHHLLSDYSSTLEQFYGENVKREDIIFPRLAAPRVLDDTVTVKMFPLSNFGSSEGLFIRKIIRSRAGSSGAISELSCSINDTVMIHFDIYNELSIPVTFSCFKFTAVFEDVDGGKSPFESLAAGDATLYPGEIKPCSAKTVFKITGRLKITGYRFKIDGTEFSSSWSDSSKSEFLNSGAEIKIGTESDGLRVNFENVDAEMAHGEIREVYANVLNISTEDIFVESVDVTGSMFFLGDGAARQSIMGCCINNNCPKHRVLLVEENGIQCRCDHEIYTVSNDIFAYMSDLKKSPGSAKIHAQSFVDLKFSIWASERGIQVYKISFNYRFSVSGRREYRFCNLSKSAKNLQVNQAAS